MGAVAALALAGLAFAPAAQAQVGYDDDVVVAVLGVATADGSGAASDTFDLPSDITEPYEVLAVGEDAAGEELIVVATLSNVTGTRITAAASGFAPGSAVTFAVRYVPAEGDGDDDDDDGAGAGGTGTGTGGTTSGMLPRTGTEPLVLGGMGIGMVLLGAAAYAGSRRRAAALVPGS